MKKLIVPKKYHELMIQTGKQKVLKILFKFPEKEFSLSDLSVEAKVAKANIGKIIDDLLKIGFVEVTKLSKIWRIKANQNNQNFIRAKIIYNLNFVYQSGLIEFLVDKFHNPKSIILFGSFRKGDDISNSDIDIAIEDEEIKDYKVVRLKELSDFEKNIGRKMQIHKFNRKNVDINVFNNIVNGIVLEGFLEVKL